jgi:hypothetical protein
VGDIRPVVGRRLGIRKEGFPPSGSGRLPSDDAACDGRLRTNGKRAELS